MNIHRTILLILSTLLSGCTFGYAPFQKASPVPLGSQRLLTVEGIPTGQTGDSLLFSARAIPYAVLNQSQVVFQVALKNNTEKPIEFGPSRITALDQNGKRLRYTPLDAAIYEMNVDRQRYQAQAILGGALVGALANMPTVYTTNSVFVVPGPYGPTVIRSDRTLVVPKHTYSDTGKRVEQRLLTRGPNYDLLMSFARDKYLTDRIVGPNEYADGLLFVHTGLFSPAKQVTLRFGDETQKMELVFEVTR